MFAARAEHGQSVAEKSHGGHRLGLSSLTVHIAMPMPAICPVFVAERCPFSPDIPVPRPPSDGRRLDRTHSRIHRGWPQNARLMPRSLRLPIFCPLQERVAAAARTPGLSDREGYSQVQ